LRGRSYHRTQAQAESRLAYTDFLATDAFRGLVVPMVTEAEAVGGCNALQMLGRTCKEAEAAVCPTWEALNPAGSAEGGGRLAWLGRGLKVQNFVL